MADHAEKNRHAGLVQDLEISSIAWSAPNWDTTTIWKPVITQRLHNCLKYMSTVDKNICLNTLLALAIPQLNLLARPPHTNSLWKISCLKGNYNVNIVWVAKPHRPLNLIEAHFVGTQKQCSQFVQKFHDKAPEMACNVRRDLSGIALENSFDKARCEGQINEPAWMIDNNIQRVIQDDLIENLPAASFQLDPDQTKVADSPPPLLIESRSGTGKTNVLFQHAVSNSRSYTHEASITCFVTVSRRLCAELRKRYDDLCGMATLPPCKFFTLLELISDLLVAVDKKENMMERACSFADYCRTHNSYERSIIEQSLVENEIGGVIMGSLEAAKQKNPLSREQYMLNIRSNISDEHACGQKMKEVVYDEFLRYKRWKLENERYDIHDIVLHILTKDPQQYFNAGGVFLPMGHPLP